MCKTKRLVNAALLAGLLALPAGVARGQVACITCPPDAQATAVGAGLTVTRENGTVLQPGQSVGACDRLNVLATVAYQPQVLIFVPPDSFQLVVGSGFFGGTGRISVNNVNPGSPFNVTPADMATTTVGPISCADAPVKGMNNLSYTITAADIAAGSVTFQFNYSDGHSLLGDCSLVVSASAQFVANIVGLPSCSIAPASREVCAGSSASFTASSTGPAGGAPHTFTWTGPGGFTATGPTITINNAQEANEGTYTATITDQFGCTSTCTAVLIVNPNPTCVIQPASQEVCAGASATFTVNISSGTAPFTITWTGPGGFTGSGPSITINNAQEANEGTYTANVVDSKGCTTSCTAQLIVNPNPTCVIQPASQEVCVGASATFTVNISSGTAPFTITWTGPGGFTGSGPSITINNAQEANEGTYTANVVDSKGCTTSCTAQLIVNPNPTCVIAPATQQICQGASATFTVTVSSGTAPFTISWTGPGGFTGSGPSITINNAQAANAGTYTANVVDSKGCTTSCSAQLNVVPCNPDIEITKEVACYLPGDTCGTYSNVATGVRDGECPAFCYRITVRNVDDDVTVTTLTVNDTLMGNISSHFQSALPLVPGESVTVEFKAVTLCQDTHNVATAEGRSAEGLVDVDTDDADAIVLNINIVCDLTLFSSIDMDENPNNNTVTLPAGSANTPVEFNLVLRNTGTSPLNVTSISGLPALVDCTDLVTPVVPVLPIRLGPNESATLSACVLVSCPGAQFSVSAHAEASDEGGTLCVFDENGVRVADDTAVCPAVVTCETPVTCRVTGGGVLLPDTTDESCITVETTIFPSTSPNGLVVNKITHGGQLGAPFSHEDCGEILGNPCIRGQWQHVRHYLGTANPRDVIDMNFHTVTPKGVFDSLNCACLGCCDPETGVFITPIALGSLCNPDDHKVCGPQPRPAPANAIIFSGIGRSTPVDDVRGGRPAQAEWVIFRIYIEDRSEPGGFHPKGAIEPADIYCFQAWKTGIKVSKKPDFTTVSESFRRALGQANCDFLAALQSGALPIGTLPPPTVQGITADIQDCGPMSTGNHQIHPSTSATCNQ